MKPPIYYVKPRFFDYNKRRNKTKSPVPSLNNINNSLLHFSELLNYNFLAVLDADALGYSNYGIKVMHFFLNGIVVPIARWTNFGE